MGNIFDDLDTDPMASAAVRPLMPAAEVQARAHIVNGGQVMAHDCPRCSGSGVWRGYSRNFPCRACNGTGKTTQAKAAAAKGAKTKAENRAKWREDHADLIAYIGRRVDRGSTFYAKLQNDLDQWGTLHDGKVEMIRKDMAADAAKLREWRTAKDAEATTKSGTVGVEAINALFETALGNGLSKPIFRTERLTIKLAKRHADTLYVTDRALGDVYVGKIVAGQFMARSEAQADTLSILCEIAADPTKAATHYGRSTGSCGCCGRELTDPDSVAAGIGPICAEKWGL